MNEHRTVVARTNHAFEALVNFRDLGGLPLVDGGSTRSGQVYRSDGMHRATTADRERLRDIGITAVIDLRTDTEIGEEGALDDVAGLDFNHTPLFASVTPVAERRIDDPRTYMADRYSKLVLENGRRVAPALVAIAASRGPCAFHCTAGKDRTGVIAALLLALVGVTDDAISADYAASTDAVPALAAWYEQHRPSTSRVRSSGQSAVDQALLRADPTTILTVLDRVRETHSTVEAWALGVGLTSSMIDLLRARLTS